MHKIVIFGSGKGSNARAVIDYFNQHKTLQVAALVSDRPRRGFLDISYDYRINLEIIKGEELADPKWIAHLKLMYRPDVIVLAGFLKLIPSELIAAFPDRIINLHPALLPKFGGKGMYGMHVHKAVLDAGETQSGITIHLVNERYDEGEIIVQQSCEVLAGDTPQSLAERIHQLEHLHLPVAIEQFTERQFS
jgi:phosphoribosylglycinamide formyltransferase-1